MKPNFGRFIDLKSGRRTAVRLALPLALATAMAAATATAGPAHAASDIVIKDFILTHAIDEREPIDMVEGFTPADETGFAFFRIDNGGPPSGLTAVWTHEGNVHASIDLNVGTSSGWRTWSSANLKPGDWTVQLRDTQGVILAERHFAVESEFAMDQGAYAEPGEDMAPAGAAFGHEPARQIEDWPDFDG